MRVAASIVLGLLFCTPAAAEPAVETRAPGDPVRGADTGRKPPVHRSTC